MGYARNITANPPFVSWRFSCTLEGMPTSMTGIFRDNVAALLLRKDGRVLIGECADKPGSWSFPQGGVDDGETRREAMVRELREEIHLGPRHYTVIGSRSGYSYTYPPGRLKKGVYCGQMQTYFLCRLLHGEPRASKNGKRKQEFLQLKWIKPAELDLRMIPGFKRLLTARVMADFFGVVLPHAAPSADTAPDDQSGDSDSMV
jgi:putative (di)nucleoside polyphosphate hydrolase